MKRLVRTLDPTRLVTVAQVAVHGKGVSDITDVEGFNYFDELTDAFHQKFPAKPMIGTETASTVTTRGIYARNAEQGYVPAYDGAYAGYNKSAEAWWKVYAERSFLAGGFVWTGFDYRGEPTPFQWPCISSHFGILDTCGFPKDNFYYYQAWWGARPVLHLLPHWNWAGKEGQEIEVWCHTNLERVELFVNGKDLGAQEVPRNTHIVWKVKYEPGVLEARGFKDGKAALTARRETTGPPARIVLLPDRERLTADGEAVAIVRVEVQDGQGRVVPVADNEISFRIRGEGTADRRRQW